MKKILFFIAFILCHSISYAQYKGGMEVGGNIMGADVYFEESIETKNSWGIRLGYVGEYHLSDHVYARGAVLINQRGFQYADQRWGLNAIDVPINLGYSLTPSGKTPRVFIDGGVNFQYNFRAFTKINGELVTLDIGSGEEDIKTISTGLNVGAGLQFSDAIKVRLNYYHGITNLVRTPGDEWKNRVYGVALNYFFKQ